MAEPTQLRPAKGGVFHKSPVQALPDASLITGELNDITRRLKVLEERYINLRRKTQVTDQNMLEHNKRITTELKLFGSELTDLKKDIFDIKSTIRKIITELQMAAKKEDVAILQKYINLWQPMNFVTQKEVESIIRDILEEKKSEGK